MAESSAAANLSNASATKNRMVESELPRRKKDTKNKDLERTEKNEIVRRGARW